MGRSSKNPNHPLTRLRKILTGDGPEVTREIFSERTGIPLGSVKAIETGVYKLSPELAKKVTFATGVDTMSLFIGEDPLRDIFGNQYTYASYEQFQLSNELGPVDKMVDAHALCLRMLGLLRAVKAKDYNQLFVRLFSELETVRTQSEIEGAKEEFDLTEFTVLHHVAEKRLSKYYAFLNPPAPGETPSDAVKLLNFSSYLDKFSGEETAPKKPRAKTRKHSKRAAG